MNIRYFLNSNLLEVKHRIFKFPENVHTKNKSKIVSQVLVDMICYGDLLVYYSWPRTLLRENHQREINFSQKLANFSFEMLEMAMSHFGLGIFYKYPEKVGLRSGEGMN